MASAGRITAGWSGLLLVTWIGSGSCQPGSLPCSRNDEWRQICADGGGAAEGGSGGNTAGSGGSTGGTSGAGGTGGNATGGMPGTAVTASTLIPDCDAYKTAKDMDRFFDMRCSSNPGCHQPGAVHGDMKTENLFMRATTTTTNFACKGSPWIDKADHTKGMLWSKIQEMPKCPSGSGGFGKMPMAPQMALSAAERTCLENFIKLFK